MKNLIYLAIILLGLGVLTSCTKEGGNQNSIVGSWKIVNSNVSGYLGVDAGDVWRFETSGAYSINGHTFGQYRYDKNEKVIIFFDEGEETGELKVLTLSSKRLITSFGPNEFVIEFERVN